MEPRSVVEIGGEDAPRLVRLMEALDEQDDVDAVHANFDIPADVLEQVAA
jgi:transcriptional/translational regulatory protein YebC/TACO1